jgi:hypothetical protein
MPVWGERAGERILLDDLPSAGIDHDEQWKDVFHSVMMRKV